MHCSKLELRVREYVFSYELIFVVKHNKHKITCKDIKIFSYTQIFCYISKKYLLFCNFCIMTFAFYLPLVFIGTSSEPHRNLIGTSPILYLAFFLLSTDNTRTIYALFTDNKRTIDMVSRRVRYEKHEILIYVKIYVFYPLLIPSARVR